MTQLDGFCFMTKMTLATLLISIHIYRVSTLAETLVITGTLLRFRCFDRYRVKIYRNFRLTMYLKYL